MSSAPKPMPHQAEQPRKSNLKSLPLVAIVGPTASGKSALGVLLAQRFWGEILACDSTQVFRGFDIGTSKPSTEERQGITHHLMDLVDPDFLFTAGEYRARAIAVLDELCQRSRLPILTVGTGLYLRALLEGLADLPARSEELRSRLEALAETHTLQHLHEILRRLDPEAAARIAQRDRPKLIRALEVSLLTGRPLTELHREGRIGLAGYAPLKIGLQPQRAALYSRIERRVHAMLERGWIEEVKSLIQSGVSPDAKPFDFIGYSQLRAHLEGTITLAAALKEISQSTRRYAKRQVTWFRKESQVHWLPGFGDDPAIAASAEQLVAEHLQQEGRAQQY
jgi:tRNA dimethylallyltransferase